MLPVVSSAIPTTSQSTASVCCPWGALRAKFNTRESAWRVVQQEQEDKAELVSGHVHRLRPTSTRDSATAPAPPKAEPKTHASE